MNLSMKEDIWNMEGSCADRHDIRKAVLFIGNGRIIFLQIRGIRRKRAQMSGKNGKKKFFLLLAGILLVLNSISSGVYAMELGGFDVMTGVDDVDDLSLIHIFTVNWMEQLQKSVILLRQHQMAVIL